MIDYRLESTDRSIADHNCVLENKHKDVLNNLAAGKIDDAITSVLEEVAKQVGNNYKA